MKVPKKSYIHELQNQPKGLANETLRRRDIVAHANVCQCSRARNILASRTQILLPKHMFPNLKFVHILRNSSRENEPISRFSPFPNISLKIQIARQFCRPTMFASSKIVALVAITHYKIKLNDIRDCTDTHVLQISPNSWRGFIVPLFELRNSRSNFHRAFVTDPGPS